MKWEGRSLEFEVRKNVIETLNLRFNSRVDIYFILNARFNVWLERISKTHNL